MSPEYRPRHASDTVDTTDHVDHADHVDAGHLGRPGAGPGPGSAGSPEPGPSSPGSSEPGPDSAGSAGSARQNPVRRDNPARQIAGELALTLRGRSLDVIAAELRRRLTAVGLRPIGDDFLQLVNAISDGSAATD